MTQAKVVKKLNEEYEKQKKHIPQLIGSDKVGTIFDVTFLTDDIAIELENALRLLIEPLVQMNMLPEITLDMIRATKIRPLVKTLIADVKRGAGPSRFLRPPGLDVWDSTNVKPGAFYLKRAKGGVGITFRFIRGMNAGKLIGASDYRVNGVVNAMVDALYDDWVMQTGELFGQLPTIQQQPGAAAALKKSTATRRRKVRDALSIAHDEPTAKGAMMLGRLKETQPVTVLHRSSKILQKIKPSLQLTGWITVTDVVKQIEDNLELDYGRNFKKTRKLGGFNFRYWISTSIRKRVTSGEVTDIGSETTPRIKHKEVPKAVNQMFTKHYGRIGAWLFKATGSPSPKSQVIDDTLKEIIRPYTLAGKPDFRYKINRSLRNLKQFKKKTDKFPGKRAKSYKPRTGKVTYAVRGKNTSGGIEEGTGTQASTSTAADLARLRQYINSRLPAEVRRNMGRPALQNRSGRFSNSAEIVSLREAQNTIMAKYTYLLRPYSTFENTGRKRWPMSYNPKPLIAKSIRNLAQGRIQQKLTVRRV